MKPIGIRWWRAVVPLLVLLQAVAAADRVTLEELMAAFAEVEAMSAGFREVRTLEILQAPLVSTGRLCYRAPDTFIKESLKPHHERLTLRGDEAQISRGSETRSISLDEHPALRAVAESFRATLGGDLATLQRYYHVHLEGQRDDWTLKLTPRAEAAAAVVSAITLHGAGTRVRRVETLRGGGERSVMTLEPARH